MTDHLAQIDPFIAVNWPGNCLCGPYLPHSLVRLGPDTLPPVDTTGYRSGQPILCFSHTRVSGTGGGGRYGNIGVTPFIGPVRLGHDAYPPAEETAACGYYSVLLQPAGIRAELTSTPRVGVHRYTFPPGTEAGILLDVGAVIQVAGNKPGEWTGVSIGGFVEWISDRELVGRADCRGGWGHQFPYSVFFYAQFDQTPVQRIVANAAGIVPGICTDGPNCRALAGFGKIGTVGLKVGISFVSIAKARASVDCEVAGRDFDAIRHVAEETWRHRLAAIEIEGGTADERKLFTTFFTRLVCMPTDLGIDDEFPLWHSGVRHFTDYYCLWDSARNANSLIGLFDPELEVAMLNCLLDVADRTGWIPDAWIAGHSAMVQGGSSADILLCEAALKGLPGIDYEKALRQMRKNNEVESPDPWLHGRHLKDYTAHGFVSTATRGCVSRHLEYAYQDWCIGALAQKLGHEKLAETYFHHSRKLWNLWRDDLKTFVPRHPDGGWVDPFDPHFTQPDSWNNAHFYEGTSVQWSFNAQHDFAGLVARHGGAPAFLAHLDQFFDGGHHYSKETMLHVPYLYIYAGRPDRAADRVRECLAKYFQPTRDGLHDNEDMGCQSAFYMCSTMGLYPMMGQDLYLLTTPAFTRTTIQLGQSGRILVIDAPQAGPEAKYIVAAKLNGQPLNRAWIRHTEIAAGAHLEFELSSKPGSWGAGQVPPSPLAG